MSHDCDCANCMESDSRWAPYRETQRALREDCPRGVHSADLLRCTLGEPESAEYWCRHCRVLVDENGNPMPPKYEALDIANKRAGNLVQAAMEAIELTQDFKTFDQLDGKCPCKRHRTYKAIRKPTSGCEECWRFYIKRHP